MTWLRWMMVCSIGLATMVATGCSDDDGAADADGDAADAAADMTPADMAVDMARPDMAADMMPDMMMSGECSPFADGSCDDGEKCSLVIDQTDEEDIMVFYGCVDGSEVRPARAACSFNVDATPDNRADEAVADNCIQGTFCSDINATPRAPFRSCELMCNDENPCEGEGEFCLRINSEPPFGICRRTADCDPVFQTGCRRGQACYVLFNTPGDVITDCFDFEPMEGETGEVGSVCEFLDQCLPGGSCRQVTEEESRCLQICNAGDDVPDMGAADMGTDAADAGTDAAADAMGDAAGDAADDAAGDAAGDAMSDAAGDAMSDASDAGMDAGPEFTGICPPDLTCLPFEVEEGRMILSPTPPGICATPEDEG